MSFELDRESYQSSFRYYRPESKGAYAIGMLLLAILAHPPTQLAIFLWMNYLLLIEARVPVRRYIKWFSVPFLFLLLSAPAILLEIMPANQNHVLIAATPIGQYMFGISKEGVLLFVQLFVRSMAAVSCFMFLVFTTPATQLFFTLKKLGLPHFLLDIIVSMYRFLFLFYKMAQEYWMAAKVRQTSFAGVKGIKNASFLLMQLLGRIFDTYRNVQIGITSRGYEGEMWSIREQGEQPIPRGLLIKAIIGFIMVILLEGYQLFIHK